MRRCTPRSLTWSAITSLHLFFSRNTSGRIFLASGSPVSSSAKSKSKTQIHGDVNSTTWVRCVPGRTDDRQKHRPKNQKLGDKADRMISALPNDDTYPPLTVKSVRCMVRPGEPALGGRIRGVAAGITDLSYGEYYDKQGCNYFVFIGWPAGRFRSDVGTSRGRFVR
jgi:hypothetical protein